MYVIEGPSPSPLHRFAELHELVLAKERPFEREKSFWQLVVLFPSGKANNQRMVLLFDKKRGFLSSGHKKSD